MNIKDKTLDEIFEMTEADFRQLLMDSNLSSQEIYLEQMFRYYREFCGDGGGTLESVRKAAHRGETIKALCDLFGYMGDAFQMDFHFYDTLAGTRIKQNVSNRASAAASAHHPPGKKEQTEKALEEIEAMMKEGKHPEWWHHDFVADGRRKYSALQARPGQKQPPRDKFWRGVIKLCKLYGYRISGK